MKKQILFLMMAVMATATAFGQAIQGSAPRGISCPDDALHPVAGKSYNYEAASNQPGNYTFWATKDVNFISTTGGVTTTNIATRLTTPADLLATSPNYGVSNAANVVSITWSDAVLNGTTAAAPTFIAVNQDGTCANNFKAWSITPIKAFTVDIRNIEDATKASMAFDATEDQCIDQVRDAKFDIATNTMLYDFGTNVLYFEVIAANFTNSWTPTFNLTGLGNGQTAVIEWDIDKTFATPVTVTSGTPSASPVTTTATNTNNGISIYVRVTISNHTYEGIAATPIALAVDGVNSVGDWDIENNTLTNVGPLCNAGALNDQMDVATQTINPRPTVTPTAPAPFVTGNQTN